MKRRPTKRAFVLVAIGLLLVLVGSTAQAGWLFVLAAGVFGIVAASFVTRHRLGKLEVVRSLPDRVRAGDEMRVGLSVRNPGGGRSPLMVLEDAFPSLAPTRVAVEALDPGGTGHLELVRTAHRRGAYAEGPITLTSGAPFGLVRARRVVVTTSPVVVVPRWVELTSFPILEPSSYPAEELHERARTGGGIEYLGVREYRPGDPPRHVHWRSTARAGRLVVREYEEAAASRVVIVIGGADTGTPPASAFETLVAAAASIGVYALMTGHPIDLVAQQDGGSLRLSEPTRRDMLDWLAALDPCDEPLDEVTLEAARRIRSRATVVLVGPTAGRAGASLTSSVRAAQQSGSRAVAVIARSSTWAEPDAKGPPSMDETAVVDAARSRA
ncbi:MAG: DUF58 domain-containing protein, partial [Actinomycetota bacterium]|nr:DUF58 domain-containing protein [Actinomycetota bacterium]